MQRQLGSLVIVIVHNLLLIINLLVDVLLKSGSFFPGTVAVWTQKNFFLLLTRPQGSQGCQKITFIFLQMKLFSFCAKIALKRHKLQKPSKLKKTCKKTLFSQTFSNILQIGGNFSAPNLNWHVQWIQAHLLLFQPMRGIEL